MKEKNHIAFSGTYFEKDAVLRLEKWLRIIAWILLAAYFVEAGYNLYQNIVNYIVGGFPLDIYFIISISFRLAQGAMVFVILQAAAKILLILMDIEDNTRRTARKNAPDGQ